MSPDHSIVAVGVTLATPIADGCCRRSVGPLLELSAGSFRPLQVLPWARATVAARRIPHRRRRDRQSPPRRTASEIQIGDADEHLIAGLMAECVVVGLEMVGIDDQEREGRFLTYRAPPFGGRSSRRTCAGSSSPSASRSLQVPRACPRRARGGRSLGRGNSVTREHERESVRP